MCAFAPVLLCATAVLLEGGVSLPPNPIPAERFAADAFAMWTKELTGSPCAIGFVRLLGDAHGVTGDGFRLDVTNGVATLGAKEPFGFIAGVHYVLTRFGGIRWFTPDSGADIPEGVKELRLPEGTLIRNPLRYRAGLSPYWGNLATPEMRRDLDHWHVRNGFRSKDFALGGEPRLIKTSHFATADVLKGAEAGRKELEDFRAWKAKTYPDKVVTWSFFATGVPSPEVWWDLVNPLAREALVDPLVRVEVSVLQGAQAYPSSSTSRPLADHRLSVRFFTHGRCHLHALEDRECPNNAIIRERLLAWRRVGIEVNAFEFMNQLAGKCNYAFWERAWVRDLKWYARNGISSSEGGLVGPWGGNEAYMYDNCAKARWLTAYLTGWFSWDTEDDLDTVREEALRRYYRAAAEPMKRYHALLEQALLDSGACMTYGGGTAFVAAVQVPGVLEKGKAFLAEARARVGGDAELGRRLARDEEYFRVEWLEAIPEPTAEETLSLPAELKFGASELSVCKNDTELVVSLKMARSEAGYRDVADNGSVFAAMNGTHAEFLLFTPEMKGRYWHFAVSHNGIIYSALSENGQSRDLTSKLDVQAERRDTAAGWTLVCRIPLGALGEHPRYVRMDVHDGTRTLSGRGFHQPLNAPAFVLTEPMGIR